MRPAALGFVALLLASCAPIAANRPVTLPAGRWGGDQIGLDIEPSGEGRITLPCAGATFAGPIKIDVGGHFLATGTYIQGSGAPPPEPPTPVPANISGRLDDDGTLWLDVATASGRVVENKSLKLGREPVIYFCP